MARSFELDLSKLQRAVKRLPDAAERGAKRALDDIKDDWLREARDVAPLDTGNLRRQLDGEVNGQTLDTLVVEMHGNATQKNGSGRFNYGYYIHEQDAGGKNLRTPGTVKKFLDQPAEQNEKKWQEWLEEEIGDEFDREGWR